MPDITTIQSNKNFAGTDADHKNDEAPIPETRTVRDAAAQRLASDLANPRRERESAVFSATKSYVEGTKTCDPEESIGRVSERHAMTISNMKHAMWNASESGNLRALRFFLSQKLSIGNLINAPLFGGKTLLHRAAAKFFEYASLASALKTRVESTQIYVRAYEAQISHLKEQEAAVLGADSSEATRGDKLIAIDENINQCRMFLDNAQRDFAGLNSEFLRIQALTDQHKEVCLLLLRHGASVDTGDIKGVSVYDANPGLVNEFFGEQGNRCLGKRIDAFKTAKFGSPFGGDYAPYVDPD